jgi:hypothetical protein
MGIYFSDESIFAADDGPADPPLTEEEIRINKEYNERHRDKVRRGWEALKAVWQFEQRTIDHWDDPWVLVRFSRSMPEEDRQRAIRILDEVE